MAKTTKTFSTRAFVALILAFCGLGLPVTGWMNHVPGFLPVSVERHAWMSAHNVLGLLIVVFSIWHVAVNHRALYNHVRSVAAGGPAASREAMLTTTVVALALLFFIGHAFHAGG